MNEFYVYAWTRPDTGDVFYVGKGRGKRDVSLKRYNPIFMAIWRKLNVAGTPPVVTRINSGLSESDAFSLEKSEITRLGRIDLGTGKLANLTDGGEGSSGAVVSDETRAKQSASLTGIPRNPQWLSKMSSGLIGNKNALGATRSAETRAKMSAAQSKKTVSAASRQKISASVSVIVRSADLRSDNTSGFKGVSYCIRRDKWQAGIYLDGKRRSLGRFSTAVEAAKAYDTAAIREWGADCFLNFPNLIEAA